MDNPNFVDPWDHIDLKPWPDLNDNKIVINISLEDFDLDYDLLNNQKRKTTIKKAKVDTSGWLKEKRA
jgi:hypothetical protein